MHSPTPPAVIAMLSYSSRLLLTETSSATVNPGSSNSTLDDLPNSSIAMTSGEGYSHYGIND